MSSAGAALGVELGADPTAGGTKVVPMPRHLYVALPAYLPAPVMHVAVAAHPLCTWGRYPPARQPRTGDEEGGDDEQDDAAALAEAARRTEKTEEMAERARERLKRAVRPPIG